MNLTPDKNFRFNRASKMVMALLPTKEARSVYKSTMIQAQLADEAAKRASLRSRDDKAPRGVSRGAVAPE
jgi:hypothetical protein